MPALFGVAARCVETLPHLVAAGVHGTHSVDFLLS